jgi:hypothetical protein
MPRRVPQLRDDVRVELVLPPQTEEWADTLLADIEATDVERTDDALLVYHEVGGNCDGLSNLRSWLGDVEDAMQEGNVDLMEFTVKVTALDPNRAAPASTEKRED